MTQRGSAVVEFALVVPLVLALVLGLVEVALVARAQLEVVNAAREGAREAAASPDPSDAVRAARAAGTSIGSQTRRGWASGRGTRDVAVSRGWPLPRRRRR